MLTKPSVYFSISVCLDNTFGNDCSLTCEDCLNGGRCNSDHSGCVCSPGWTGVLCNESEYGVAAGWGLCPTGWLGNRNNRLCFESVKLSKEHSCVISKSEFYCNVAH